MKRFVLASTTQDLINYRSSTGYFQLKRNQRSFVSVMYVERLTTDLVLFALTRVESIEEMLKEMLLFNVEIANRSLRLLSTEVSMNAAAYILQLMRLMLAESLLLIYLSGLELILMLSGMKACFKLKI
jgi:hypothetical protein